MLRRLLAGRPEVILGRFCLLLCGVALTWMCAAFGLLVADTLFVRPGCRLRVKPVMLQVSDIQSAISQYQIDQNHCPKTKDDVRVKSAGPDRIVDTADDITNWR